MGKKKARKKTVRKKAKRKAAKKKAVKKKAAPKPSPELLEVTEQLHRLGYTYENMQFSGKTPTVEEISTFIDQRLAEKYPANRG